TIKIATQSPLSGGQAALGEGIKLGAQLAVEKFKGALEKQGFKVELVPFDDQAKPDVGVANAKNIIADKDILAIVGHLNAGEAIPSSEVYKEVSLAMISPANTNPVITDRGYPNVNRVCGRDDVQGVVGSEFAHATMKAKSVYIIHDKTPYGQGVAEFFKADAENKGLKVLGFEGTEEKSNFDPIITPMKAKNPDVIYFGGIYDQGAPFFKQAREKGVKGKFLGPDGMDSSDLTKIAGKAVVGMHYTSAAGPASALPRAKAFSEEFKKKFGKNPEPYAAEAYDAATIAIKAIEAATKGGKVPSREDVATAARKAGHRGCGGSPSQDRKETTGPAGTPPPAPPPSPRASSAQAVWRIAHGRRTSDRHLPASSARRHHPRLHVRPDRAGLHDGVRRPRVHQLRPLRDLHRGRLRRRRGHARAQERRAPRGSPLAGRPHPGPARRHGRQRAARHHGRAGRLPSAAQRPTADSAHLRDRHLVLPPGHDPALRVTLAERVQSCLPHHRRPEPPLRADRDPRRVGQVARRHRRRAPDAVGPPSDRQPDEGRYGDPRRGRGPGGGEPHGHRRQPDHLAHVPDRRRDGRRRRRP